MDLEQYADHYIHLQADCKVVKGAARSAIYDLTCGEFILVPNEYLLLLEQFRAHRIGALLALYAGDEEQEFLSEFVAFLDEQEMIVLLRDTSLFPGITAGWDFPGRIQNAIIDYDGRVTHMPEIFRQLDQLGCQFLQLRCFGDALNPDLLSVWLPAMYATALRSVEVIMRRDSNIPLSAYRELMTAQPLLSLLVLHTDTGDCSIKIDYDHELSAGAGIERELVTTTTALTSELHCGMISMKSLNTPDPSSFMEYQAYNGCLNRKIALDAAGHIRNCPSMKTSFGNISEVSLLQALETKGFTDVWTVHKDQIKVCRDCEFRYACSDCRAYLEDPEDRLSKPLKCGYDPYTATWEGWSTHPLKQKAIRHYGMEHFTAIA